MKKLLFIVALLIAGTANAQTYEWAFNVGGMDSDFGKNIATDNSGNVFVTGNFVGTADFDPSGNTANLTNGGMYVAKYDAIGNYLWAFNVEVSSGMDIAIDPAGSGNIYVTGKFQGAADFDPSANTANLISNGISDIFVAKYDANGNYLWAFNIGGTNNDYGYGITIDSAGSGDIYVTGYFRSIADFDPSANTTNLTSNGQFEDIFIAKYDANGNYLWAFNIGGTDRDYGIAISPDPAGSGDVYVTGSFYLTADFDPSANTANLTSNGGLDIFVAKYDANGNYIWAFNVGGTSDDNGWGISSDPAGSGDVYVTGWFELTADFDPSGNISNLTSNGSWDAFVASYDTNSNYKWAFNIGGTNYDGGYGITTDQAGSGDVYVTGSFINTADFDPSANTANLTSNGDDDVFVARYDAAGNYLWAFNIGGTGTDFGDDIATGPTGNTVYVTGYFGLTADFDPSGNTANLTSNNSEDIFVAKYDSSTITIGINDFSATKERINIYPNPTEGQFTISSRQGAIKKVEVYDLFGRKVKQLIPIAIGNKEQLTIDMRGFAKGMYVYMVKGEGEMVIGRGKVIIE